MTKHTDTTHAGEAIIRHWFLRSLATLLVIGVIGAAIGWYLNRDTLPPVTIEEAVVVGPVIEEDILPEAPPAVVFRDITTAPVSISSIPAAPTATSSCRRRSEVVPHFLITTTTVTRTCCW